jgi:hypothetical protein
MWITRLTSVASLFFCSDLDSSGWAAAMDFVLRLIVLFDEANYDELRHFTWVFALV